MVIARSVLFTFLGIVTIGCVLASLTPPAWGVAEMVLIVACIVLVKEYGRALEADDQRSPGTLLPGGETGFSQFGNWIFGETAGSERRARVFNPWDVTHEPYARVNAQRVHSAWAGTGHTHTDAGAGQPGRYNAALRSQSVEQMAQEMLTLAFRQASLKYHPDQGGNPESMRKVYAARELLLRGIHKI